MKIEKIYVVAAIHGDEPFGLKILANLRPYGDRIIRQVGHPEAVAKRKEYLEENLNRCFGPNTPDSKEARIAKHLMKDIEREAPDLIIDLHTCECAVGRSAITPVKTTYMIDIAKRLGMECVFIGVPDINAVSLMGQYPGKAVVLEFGRGLRSDALAEEMAQRIAGLLERPARVTKDKQIPVYSETALIQMSLEDRDQLENYVFNDKIGGYPYLVGKNTYKEYAGFMARKLEEL